MKKVGDKSDNFLIRMTNGMEFNFYETLKKGPVILNFIMGTWCPTCTAHIQRIRLWQSSFKKEKATMLTISAESNERLRAYVQSKYMTLLFASDPDQFVIGTFGLKIPYMGISRR